MKSQSLPNKSTLDTAFDLIAEGVSTIPIQPRSKKPALESWKQYQERLPTEEEIRTWFPAGTDRNLAVICGRISGNLVIFDFDTVAAAKKWAATYRSLVSGAPIVKPSRGWHVYVRTDKPVPCSRGDGYDVRGGGGYAVCPPSIHPSGKRYELIRGDLAKIPVVEAELLGLDSADGNGQAKPEDWQEPLLDGVPEGERNLTLAQLAGRYVSKKLSRKEALELLMQFDVRCKPPQGRKVVEITLDSIIKTHKRKHQKKQAVDPGTPVKDYGHAVVLARHFTDRFRWAPHRGSWMGWTGRVWRPEEDEYVAKISADTLRGEYATQLVDSGDKESIGRLTALIKETCIYARITGTLSFLKGWDGIQTRMEQWDREPWLLNVQNGVINLRSMQLEAHSPKRLLTKIASCEYHPGTKSTLWNAHIELCLPNKNVRREVQRNLGLSLVGTGVDEILPVWIGKGGNLKTTTALATRRVLGDYVAEAAPGLLLLTKYERHPTEIAELDGKRLVFSSEIGQGKRLDEELVKRLTGGDVKRGRFMRQDFFDIEQSFTIFLICNHHPSISGTDDAIWRRIRLIPWTFQISDESRLPQNEVIETLTKEAPAILQWLLDGLADWRMHREWIAPEVRAATDAYRAEQDRLSGFMTECLEIKSHYTATVKEVYLIYSAWCQKEDEEPLGKRALGNRLREQGFHNKKAGNEGVHTWFGFRVKSDVKSNLLTFADLSPIPPLRDEQILDKHESMSANVSKTGQADIFEDQK